MIYPHPYWLSVPTMYMGYLNGTSNIIDKNSKYSLLGITSFLLFLRNFQQIPYDIKVKSGLLPSVIISGFFSPLIIGSFYCIGLQIGKASINTNEKYDFSNKIKNLMNKSDLQ